MSQTHDPRLGSWDIGHAPIEVYTSDLQSLIKNKLLVVDSASMEEHIYEVNTGDFLAEVIDTTTETRVTTTEKFCLKIKAEDVGSDEEQKITVTLTELVSQRKYDFTYKDMHDVKKQFLLPLQNDGVFLPLFSATIKIKLLDWSNKGNTAPQMGLVNSFSMVVPFNAWMETEDEIHITYL